MKRYFSAFLFLLAAFIVFLIATVPARLAAGYLPPETGISLSGVSGSVWRGQALDVRYMNQSYGKLQWQIKPLALLTLRLKTDFTLSGPAMNANGTATVKRDQTLYLDNTLFSANVESLPLPAMAQMAAPSGLVKADISNATLSAGRITEANGVVNWNPARVSMPAETNLGGLKLDITTENNELIGKVSSQNSPVTVSGTVNIASNGLLKSNIKLTPTAQTPPDLRDMLPMVGKPARDGSVTLREQMKIY